MLGYSAAGVVVESRCPQFTPGDRVACAGAQFAHHAEFISVPKNLGLFVFPTPFPLTTQVIPRLARLPCRAFVRPNVRLGETVAVIGLGLLGQITVQLLKASGCRVVGLDINESLFPMAMEYGCEAVFPSRRDAAPSIKSFTRGLGTDAVIITASADSDERMLLALDVARKKSPVVIVGAVPMNVPRSPFYEGLRTPHFVQLWPVPLRPELRRRRHRLSRGVCALDREPEYGRLSGFNCFGALRVGNMTTHRIPLPRGRRAAMN